VDGKAEAYSLSGPLGKFRANKILRDRHGGLWIGTFDQGLVHVHDVLVHHQVPCPMIEALRRVAPQHHFLN
jgi:hypothetical protein